MCVYAAHPLTHDVRIRNFKLSNHETERSNEHTRLSIYLVASNPFGVGLYFPFCYFNVLKLTYLITFVIADAQ